MLKQFGALPTEKRAQDMKSRDYLWCLANDLLDGEEKLDQLCAECRDKAMEERCPSCGRPVRESEGMDNPAFDQARFERMRGGRLD